MRLKRKQEKENNISEENQMPPMPDTVEQQSSNASQALTETFNKGPLESKKWIGMALGVLCVMTVWIGTLACMFIKTSIASEFVSLATIVISFLGAIVTTLITGQAAMEWKSASSLSQMNTNNITTTRVQKDIVEDDGKTLKPFGAQAN